MAIQSKRRELARVHSFRTIGRDRIIQSNGSRTRYWLALCLATAGSTVSSANVIYVNAAAPAGGNGTNWATALNDMTTALASAQNGDQLWVAAGTYSTQSLYTSFTVPAGVSLYGGFSGTESSVDQAQPSIYHTTLRAASVSLHEGSSVLVLATAGGSTISGFTIRDGYAARTSGTKLGGGGLLIQGGTVSIRQCTFTQNSTYTMPNGDFGMGGAVCIVNNSAVTITDCAFDSNTSHGWPEWDFIPWSHRPLQGDGAAIYVSGSTLTVEHSTFTGNHAGGSSGQCITGFSLSPGAAASGGAVAARDSTVSISGSLFSGNTAGSSTGPSSWCGWPDDPVFPSPKPAGQAGQGGAISLNGGTATISRCVFTDNSAGTSNIGSGCGGAIYAAGTAKVANCRFLGNSAGNGVDSGDAGDGGGVYSLASIFFVNCEFIGNYAGTGGLSTSPAGRDGVGGAIFALGTNRFDNCTIVKNKARAQGAGTYGADLANSLVFFNDSTLLGQSLDSQMIGGTALYCNVQGWLPSGFDSIYNNSNADPRFVDMAGPDGVTGTLDDNTRLLGTSPAIDSGNALRYILDLSNNDLSQFVSVDLDDKTRIVDDPGIPNTGFQGSLDRGAYEFSPFTCMGDLNIDGQVDDADFSFFVAAYNLLDCAAWAMPAGCPADFNHDLVVDDSDFVNFVVAYNNLICP